MSVQILRNIYNLILIFIYYFPVSRVLKISKELAEMQYSNK